MATSRSTASNGNTYFNKGKEETKLQLRKRFVLKLFEHETLAVCGADARLLKEIILRKNQDPNYKFSPVKNPILSNYLNDDEYHRDFVKIWWSVKFDSNAPRNKIIRGCFEDFENSLRFGELRENIFRKNSPMISFYRLLLSVYIELKDFVYKGLYLDGFLLNRAKLPSVTNIIRLFGPIADYMRECARN